jgi:CMP-N,N'-diacetyllegionaminic acid synthase
LARKKMNKKILALVPARGGSKGLPGKNIRPLHGKPLISWTIEAALGARCISRVLVSTDDPEIAEVARAAGASAPFLRPAEIAHDTASVFDAIIHALDHMEEEFDYVALLQPTSPLRLSIDIDDAFDAMTAKRVSSVVSTSPLHKPQRFLTLREPDNRLKLWLEKDEAAEERPVIEMLNGAIYIAQVEMLRRTRSFICSDTLAHLMPFERSWDIDSIFDFMICEMMLPYVMDDSQGALKAVRG